MNKTAAHNTKAFFIDGTMVNIRPIELSDALASKAYTEVFSADGFIQLGHLQHRQNTELYHLSTEETGFVFIAVTQQSDQPPAAGAPQQQKASQQPIGVGIYAKNQNTGTHELSIGVAKEFINSRLPFEIAETLIEDAASHQVMTLSIIDNSTNRKMALLAQKLGMSVRMQPAAGDRTVHYSLQVDKHPGIVVF